MTVPADRPLIGVIRQRHGQEVVDYFTDDADLNAASSDDVIQAALSVIGGWSDLDIVETLDALDRIRHETRPTPPIDLSDLD